MFSWFSLALVEKMLSGAFFPVLHHNLFLLQNVSLCNLGLL